MRKSFSLCDANTAVATFCTHIGLLFKKGVYLPSKLGAFISLKETPKQVQSKRGSKWTSSIYISQLHELYTMESPKHHSGVGPLQQSIGARKVSNQRFHLRSGLIRQTTRSLHTLQSLSIR